MSPLADASPGTAPVRALVDGVHDTHLDAVCRTAAALFGTRYAFVSRLDAERQYFLGREGSEEDGTPRSVAFCALAVLGAPHEPLVVLDARADPRVANNPLVTGAPHLRFYAGVPLASPSPRCRRRRPAAAPPNAGRVPCTGCESACDLLTVMPRRPSIRRVV